MIVRALRSEDHDDWIELWSGYVRFYRDEVSEELTATTFQRLCEEHDGMFALVAVEEGGSERLVGLAHSVVHPSTWSMTGYCYLEDLFVARQARGRGVERVYWHTQEFNGAARSLYDSVGQLTSMVVYERDV
jgi:GNAT superfamily N-acetyltransferase